MPDTTDRRLVMHRETRVSVVFAVHDGEGNHLFDYPVTARAQSFSRRTWDEIRDQMEHAQCCLKDGTISASEQTLPPIPEPDLKRTGGTGGEVTLRGVGAEPQE